MKRSLAKIWLMAATMLSITNFLHAQPQLPKWCLDRIILDMQAPFSGGSTAPVPGIPSTFYGVNASNAFFDEKPASNLLFAVSHMQVYSASGNYLGELSGTNTNLMNGPPEVAIVPFVNNDFCNNKFYIFYTTNNGTDKVYLDCRIVTVNNLNGSCTLSSNINLATGDGRFGSIAVSRLNNGKRFLYFVSEKSINKVEIITPTTQSPNGLAAAISLSIPSSVFNGVSFEADLSHDGTKLAWGCSDPNNSNFYIVGLNQDGNYNGTISSFQVNSNSGVTPHGVEFDASGNELYITTGKIASSTDGIYVKDLVGGGLSYVANSQDFGASQIELGILGYQYVAAATDPNYIVGVAKINNNYLLDVNSTMSVTSPRILSNPPLMFRLLPDQIDGEVHTSGYFSDPFGFDHVVLNSQQEIDNFMNSLPAQTAKVKGSIQFVNPNPSTPVQYNFGITNQYSTLYMGNNAQVTVGNGVELNISYANFKSLCNYLWSGIKVLPGGKLNISNSKIEDADIGIEVTSNYFLACSYNVFSANRTHIKSYSLNQQSFIDNCSFNSIPSLKTGAAVPEYGATAIDISTPTASTLSSYISITKCNFTGGKTGIKISATNARIQGCTFNNMAGATGIYADMGNTEALLEVGYIPGGGSVANDKNIFYALKQALVLKNKGNLVFNSNEVSHSTSHALELSNNRDCNISVRDNVFTHNALSSVMLANNAGTPNNNRTILTVEGNKFLYSKFLMSNGNRHLFNAVTISENTQTTGPSYKELKVSANEINNVGYGVKTFNVVGFNKPNKVFDNPNEKVLISSNTINYVSTASGSSQLVSDYNSGIQLNNSIGFRVGLNKVHGSMNHVWRNRGIHSNNTTYTLFYDNEVRSGRGISSMDFSLWNDYKCNDFQICHTGVSYGDHTMRIPGDVHGIPNTDSRDNTYINPLSVDMEIYVWNFGTGTRSIADIDNLLLRNKTLFASNISPEIVAEPSPSIAPSTPNALLRDGNAPNLCNYPPQQDPDEPGDNIPPPPSNGEDVDYFTNWQWQYLYEKQQKQNGLVYNLFLNQYVTIEELIAVGNYSDAITVLGSMVTGNLYENNIKEVLQVVIDCNYPEERPLTVSEIAILEGIAQMHPRIGGNAVYTARAVLWHKEGLVFTDYEYLERPLGLAAQLLYKPCMEALPDPMGMQLIDQNGIIYDTIPVMVDTSGFVFIKPQHIIGLDTNLVYSFVYTTGSFPPVPYLSLNSWINNGVTEIGMCSYGKRNGADNINTPLSKVANEVKVYPNPAADLVIIDLPDNGYSVELYTLHGKKVLAQHTDENRLILDAKTIGEGLYLVKLKHTLSGKGYSQKLLITK